MPNYKLVDSDKLNSDLTTVADAIRAKGGTTEALLFPDGMKTAIENIKTGGGSGGGEEWFNDGKTHLWIEIAAEGRMDVPLLFYQTVANGVAIDWGDGSAPETFNSTGHQNLIHTYADIGNYVITLDVSDGCTLTLGGNGSSYNVMGSASSTDNKVYINMLKKVEIGSGAIKTAYAFYDCNSLRSALFSNEQLQDYTFYNCDGLTSVEISDGVTIIGRKAFQGCNALASIVIPGGVTSIGTSAFADCHTLNSVVIPDSVTTIGGDALYNAYCITNIVLPNNITSIGSSIVANCHSLASIVIPGGVTSIGASAFMNGYGMKFYDFTKHTAVPTLSATSAFQNIPSDCEIRVPAALVDEWKAATNWSTYAANIVGV